MSISRAIISVGLTALPQGIDAVQVGSFASVTGRKKLQVSNATEQTAAVTTGPRAPSDVWYAAFPQALTVIEPHVQKVFDTFASSGVWEKNQPSVINIFIPLRNYRFIINYIINYKKKYK